jgi:hypothetical protein
MIDLSANKAIVSACKSKYYFASLYALERSIKGGGVISWGLIRARCLDIIREVVNRDAVDNGWSRFSVGIMDKIHMRNNLVEYLEAKYKEQV